MGQLSTKFTDIVEILHGELDEGVTLPFVQDIFLMETRVAGTTYLQLEEVEKGLEIGNFIYCKREPDNPYDKNAILLLDRNSNKLGYIPRSENKILARLMDAGKLVYAKLKEKEWQGNWLKLELSIYMRDM